MCGWPPACKRKVDGCERRACGHVSGLFARRTRPLATMDVRGPGPHQILGFEALDFFRLTQPVGTTDTSISFSLLQALAGRSHGFVRPQQPADSILLLSSPPRRSARSCWPVLPPPSAVRSVPTDPGSTDWLWPPSSAAEPFGRRHQQSSKILIALAGDPAQPLLAACRLLTQRQAQPGCELAPAAESGRVRDGGGDGR